MKPNEYEKQAQEVADKIGIEIVMAYQGGQCPEWATSRKDRPRDRHACPDCGTVHGDKYRVTIKRKVTPDERRSISFDYWASWASCNVTAGDIRRMKSSERVARGIPFGLGRDDHDSKVFKVKVKPSVYDILACVSSDISSSTDPDEIYEEFGEMKPSQAHRIAEHARKLQAFFTEEERALLAEVQ